jgi:hypothetical protein
MPKHLTATANSKRRKCPLAGAHGPVDQIIVQGWDREVRYEIPRICAEFLGIAPGVLNAGQTTWFGPEESTAMREHKHTILYEPRHRVTPDSVNDSEEPR